jgi:hypothetical protein
MRAGVPLDLSLRRPRWWRPPRRGRSITGSITGRFITGRSITGWAPVVVVVPVTAAIPVLVRAPAWVPLFAWAPVMVIHRCRRRRRLGSARCQTERGQGHAASRQGASAQTKPRFLHVGIHAPENSPWDAHKTLLVGSLNSNPARSWDSCAVNISRRIPPYRYFAFPGQVHRRGAPSYKLFGGRLWRDALNDVVDGGAATKHVACAPAISRRSSSSASATAIDGSVPPHSS